MCKINSTTREASPFLSVITLSVNESMKLFKQKTEIGIRDKKYMTQLQETHLRSKDTIRLKVKGWKKIFYANSNQKRAGVTVLIIR